MILDTGPLRELLAYRAANDLHFMSLQKELKHLRSAEAYQNCGSFISKFPRKMTSASVVVELNGWIRVTPSKGHRQLWQLVRDEFDKMGMDEHMVRFVEMGLDLVTTHGPVDASLLQIAQRHRTHDPMVITIDEGLREECRKVPISAISMLEACLSDA